jgi:hypothetical protein
MTTAKSVPVDLVRFAVLDRAVCVLGQDLPGDNLRFLRGLDPEFFLYQASAHQHPDVGGAGATRAALALRLNYSMAVEALFGMLGAVMQAPDCVFGWLSAYKNDELRGLVHRVSNGEPLKTLPPFRPTTWSQVSSALLEPLREQDTDRHATVRDLFAKAWGIFASDLLSESSSREYNSLKHSFRVQPGSVTIDISHQGKSLLKSESALAHSFPFLRRTKERKNHYNVSYATLALEPTFCAVALSVIALSINNAIAFARTRAGDTAPGVAVRFPESLELFEELWKPRAPVAALTYGGSVTIPDAEYWSDAEILSVYDDAPDTEVTRD